MNTSRKMMRDKKGFTLIEVIVVIVILLIIAAIAVPSAIGYIKKSHQNSRIETARAIFSVAQNAMTHLYAKGNEDELEADGKLDVTQISPASLRPTDAAANAKYMRYISLNSDGSRSDAAGTAVKEDTAVYKLLESYLSDKSLLDDTILIEYNYKTGKVMSAFYSDERANIGYKNTNEYDVYTRDRDTLADNETGYWSVKSTGRVEGSSLDDVEIKLADYDGSSDAGGYDINNGNNYGLLTCEMVVPQVEPESYDYTITLRQGSNEKEITIGDGTDRNYSWNDIKANTSVEAAVNGNGFYLDKTSDGRQLLVLIIDTPYSGYSISSKFAALQPGSMTASMKAATDGDDRTVTSDSKNTYFASQSADGANTKCEVASIRHLNNVRYFTDSTAEYEQTRDIKCRDYNDAVLKFTPIAAVDSSAANDGTQGFLGSYNGKAYTIYDLTVPKSDGRGQAALIANTGKSAVIQDITLDYSKAYVNEYNNAADKSDYYISAVDSATANTSDTTNAGYAGSICAINYGTIRNCTVRGGRVTVYAKADSAVAGGICGFNTGTGASRGMIAGCYNGADVIGTDADGTGYYANCYAGGICGFSFADVEYCENGTARDSSGMLGTPYFGSGTATADYPEGCRNDAVTIDASNAGGICGGASKEADYTRIMKKSYLTDGATIQYCVNAAAVKGQYADNNGTEGRIGGICGRFYGSNTSTSDAVPTLQYCYNAGSVTAESAASGIAGTIPKQCNGGGLAGAMTKGKDKSSVKISSSYNTGTVTAVGVKYARTGGLVGWLGFGTVSDCYSVGKIVTIDDSDFEGSAFGCGNSGSSVSTSNVAARNDMNQNSGGTYSISGRAAYKSLANIAASSFAGMSSGDSAGVGPFKYIYPYLNVNNTDTKIGADFHRTPWDSIN